MIYCDNKLWWIYLDQLLGSWCAINRASYSVSTKEASTCTWEGINVNVETDSTSFSPRSQKNVEPMPASTSMGMPMTPVPIMISLLESFLPVQGHDSHPLPPLPNTERPSSPVRCASIAPPNMTTIANKSIGFDNTQYTANTRDPSK